MQPLIHQASLYGLQTPIRGSGIVLGQTVELIQHPEDKLAVFVTLPSRWPFGLGKSRRQHLGYLHPEATGILLPAIARATPLRMRIVEIEPAHARIDGVDRVCISVWGDPAHLKPL